MSVSQKQLSTLNTLANVGTYLEVGSLKKTNSELLKITQQIGYAQKQLQEAQLEVQKKIAIEAELQRIIKEQEIKRQQRQRELKSIFFAIKSSFEATRQYKDNLTKFIFLGRIEKDINEHQLNPNELEEISDKEYASEVLRLFNNEKQNVVESFSEEDRRDLEFLSTYKSIRDSYIKELDNLRNESERLKKEHKKSTNKNSSSQEKIIKLSNRLEKLKNQKL